MTRETRDDTEDAPVRAQPARTDEPPRVALGSERSRRPSAEAPTIRAKRPSELPPVGDSGGRVDVDSAAPDTSVGGTRLGVGVDPAARAARDAAFDGRATVGATRLGVNVFKPSRDDIARARRDSAAPARDASAVDGARRDSARDGRDASAADGECPDDDTLIALVEKALPAARVATLADHVDRCERCRATVGALAGTDDAVAASGDAKLVGRYELREQLGAGGMGVVWAAWDPMLERRVAIKLLRPEAGEHGPARMLREARAAAQLQHPNVVAVHDVGEHDGGVFIACELVDGEPLDRWQSGKSGDAIVDAYVQAARGLAAAHAIGLVHRDVKPSNILVAKDGRARIGDFGLARREDRAAVSIALTRAGDVVGTPAYMAPEQRHGEAVDARADQYALCVALAESLGGRRPAADTAADELRVEPRYARAIARGLRMDPEDRFADMTALADALAAPVTPRSRSRSRSRRRWIGVVAASVGVVAIGTIVALRGFGASPQNPTLVAARGVGNAVGVGIGVGSGNGNGVGVGSGNGVGYGNGNGNDGSGTGTDLGSGIGSAVGSGNSGGRRSDVGNQLATGSGAKPQFPSTAKQPKQPQQIVPPTGGGSGAQPQSQQSLGQQAWNMYVGAIDQVNSNDARCLATFAKFDAMNTTNAPLPAAIRPHDDKLHRARCQLINGQCAAGEAAITALFAAEGLSKTTVADEVHREVTMSCPTTPQHGTWRERLTRLQSQGVRTHFASVAVITQALRDLEAVVREAKGSKLTSDELVALMMAADDIAEGFARYDGHCGDARRAYALAVPPYVDSSSTDALKACLASPSTP